MIEWEDRSNLSVRFFMGTSTELCTIQEAIENLLRLLCDVIIGNGNAAKLDLIMLEVNCDTGRLIVGAATEAGFESGKVDGCAIRIQTLQDYWYDVLESGASDQEFSRRIRDRILEIGVEFMSAMESLTDRILASSATGRVRFLLYGGTTGEALFEHYYY